MSLFGKLMRWTKVSSDPEHYDNGSSFRLCSAGPASPRREGLRGSRFLDKGDYQRFLVLDIGSSPFGLTMLKVLFPTGEVGWIYLSLQGEIQFCQ